MLSSPHKMEVFWTSPMKYSWMQERSNESFSTSTNAMCLTIINCKRQFALTESRERTFHWWWRLCRRAKSVLCLTIKWLQQSVANHLTCLKRCLSPCNSLISFSATTLTKETLCPRSRSQRNPVVRITISHHKRLYRSHLRSISQPTAALRCL